MTLGPATALPPDRIFRVGREGGVVHFSEIDVFDAESESAGSRFDVPGAGVMYCATSPVGAYKEVLESYRPSAGDYSAEPGEDWLMRKGSLAAHWRNGRRLASIELLTPLPFLDVDQDRTMTFLTREIAPTLDRFGAGTLDTSVLRGPNRLITRAISKWAYGATADDGAPRFGGIRYSSRFASNECWAVFLGTTIGAVEESPIRVGDADLQAAAKDFGLTIH